MLSNSVKIDTVEIDSSNPSTEMEKSVINEIQEGFGQLILSLKCPFHNRAVAISVAHLDNGRTSYMPEWCCSEFHAIAEAEWLKHNTAN